VKRSASRNVEIKYEDMPMHFSRRAALTAFGTGLLLTGTSLVGGGSAWARAPGRAWLGVEFMLDDNGGVQIKRVFRGSPAEKGGVKAGDVVLSMDGNEVKSPRQLSKAIAETGPGVTVALKIHRGSSDQTLKIVLTEHPGDEEVLRLDKVGSFAPAWKGVQATKGDVSTVEKLRGKVVLIDFWASWCSACRMTVPELNQLQDRFGAQGLTIVGLTDDDPEVAKKAAEKFGIKYSVGCSVSADTMSDYGIHALPTLYFVDKKGVVRDISIGARGVDELSVPVKKLLKEQA
jgi:thiol-disulfide isomerase/thioredoxin